MTSAKIPPAGAERDAEIGALLGVDPARRAIATEDGTSSALTEDDPMGPGLGGYKITADDVRDFCRQHPRYHVGAWEVWPPYSTDPAACERLVEELVCRGWGIRTAAARLRSEEPTVHEAVIANPEVRRRAFGASMSAAVSAAALLALRASR